MYLSFLLLYLGRFWIVIENYPELFWMVLASGSKRSFRFNNKPNWFFGVFFLDSKFLEFSQVSSSRDPFYNLILIIIQGYLGSIPLIEISPNF